ncbi:hypothetical protein BSL78_26276 [Apostichopus japonicus]|uniref:Uncharacterized protein n=1 Tax=Stichopus japonicus TaxID=307972 RepID=A0A2G8JMG2_STIJA|nr:hypothetical protein BSL78_26276 [Apostichopus japonicus]
MLVLPVHSDPEPAITSLTTEEHHLDSLPEGWFYNGSQYLNFAGEKQLHHPNMDSFLEDYLDSCNEEIKAMNHQIDSEQYLDLFQQA